MVIVAAPFNAVPQGTLVDPLWGAHTYSDQNIEKRGVGTYLEKEHAAARGKKK